MLRILLAGLLGVVFVLGAAPRLRAERAVQIAAIDGGRWTRRFEEAESAVAAGDHRRAVDLLREAVEFGVDRLVPLERGGEDDRLQSANVVYITAAEAARRLIAALPPEGLEIYRRAEEPRARALFARAALDDDSTLLERVARLYHSTPSGIRARSRLADHYFSRGWIRRSLNLLRGLLVAPIDDGGGDVRTAEDMIAGVSRQSVQLRLLTALRVLGETDLYVAEKKRFLADPRVRGDIVFAMRIAGVESWVPAGERLRVVLAPTTGGRSFVDRLPRLAGESGEYVVEWNSPFWSGSRNGIVPTRELHRASFMADRSRFLVFRPEFTDREIYLCGVFHLWTLDLATGSLLNRTAKPAISGPAYEYLEQGDSPVYAATYHDGVVYGRTISHLVQRRQYMNYTITEFLPTRALFAADASTHRILWDTSRFHVGSAEDPKFISVVTPPMIRDGRAFVGGVFRAGLFSSVVACLDTSTGRPLWQTHLVSNQMELTMFGEPAREPFAAVLVEDEGIIYHVTQIGAVAALEARDGRILWLATYDAIATRPTVGPIPELRDIVWGTNSPLIVDGVLYVAPRDSHSFYGFDTGLRCVPSSRSRKPGVATATDTIGGRILQSHLNANGKLRDVLGFREGNIYFSGPGGIHALDISLTPSGVMRRVVSTSGSRPLPRQDRRRPAGRRASAGQARVVGRAALSDRGIVFSSHRDLRLVDYDLGEIVTLTETAFPDSRYGEYAGNVTLWKGKILLTSRDLLSSFVPRRELPGDDL